MIQWRTEPLEVWPWPDGPRRQPTFSADHAATITLLERELHHLGAFDVTLRVVTEGRWVRRDGLPRFDAVVRHDGVGLAFGSDRGPLSYRCATYCGNYYLLGWQANLRALALGLEALRTYDRHVGGDGSQYKGFLAIEAGPGALRAGEEFPGGVEAARGWLREQTGSDARVEDSELMLRGRRVLHPDRVGAGHMSTEAAAEVHKRWHRFEAAAAMLGGRR